MQLYRANHLPGWRQPLIPVKVHKVLGHKIRPKGGGNSEIQQQTTDAVGV